MTNSNITVVADQYRGINITIRRDGEPNEEVSVEELVARFEANDNSLPTQVSIIVNKVDIHPLLPQNLGPQLINLAKALGKNSTVKTLQLYSTRYRGTPILEEIYQNTSIEFVILPFGFDLLDMSDISDLLNRNTSIKEVVFSAPIEHYNLQRLVQNLYQSKIIRIGGEKYSAHANEQWQQIIKRGISNNDYITSLTIYLDEQEINLEEDLAPTRRLMALVIAELHEGTRRRCEEFSAREKYFILRGLRERGVMDVPSEQREIELLFLEELYNEFLSYNPHIIKRDLLARPSTNKPQEETEKAVGHVAMFPSAIEELEGFYIGVDKAIKRIVADTYNYFSIEMEVFKAVVRSRQFDNLPVQKKNMVAENLLCSNYAAKLLPQIEANGGSDVIKKLLAYLPNDQALSLVVGVRNNFHLFGILVKALSEEQKNQVLGWVEMERSNLDMARSMLLGDSPPPPPATEIQQPSFKLVCIGCEDKMADIRRLSAPSSDVFSRVI